MKRSEMIEIIEQVLRNSYDYPAQTLLRKIEEAGMAPPEVAEPVETSVLIATPNGYIEQKTGTSKAYVRKWEDESSPKDSNEA